MHVRHEVKPCFEVEFSCDIASKSVAWFWNVFVIKSCCSSLDRFVSFACSSFGLFEAYDLFHIWLIFAYKPS